MVHQVEMNAHMLKVIGDEQLSAMNSISHRLYSLCKKHDVIPHNGNMLILDDVFPNRKRPFPYVEIENSLDDIDLKSNAPEFEKTSSPCAKGGGNHASPSQTELRNVTSSSEDGDYDYDIIT